MENEDFVSKQKQQRDIANEYRASITIDLLRIYIFSFGKHYFK